MVLKHPHTNMMHFFQQIAVSPFLICNIQYFPVFITVGFTDIDYSKKNIEWGEQTVTL